MSAAAEPIHTLADLNGWSFSGTALAVLGHPIAHSLSPVIHNAALAELARRDPRFRYWRYFKFDVAPADLPVALKQFHRLRFRGLNLTVPHKSLAIEHLAEGDALVHAAGAANTLIATEAGWSGTNTDGYGLSRALEQRLKISVAGANVILLGAGGAARGAAVECLRAHAASLWIGNRTQNTLNTLLAELQPLAGETALGGFDLARPPADLPAGALVINATSVGLKPDDPSPVDLDRLSKPRAVFDMIYRATPTALLQQAARLGVSHSDGLAMLVHQGARALQRWTSVEVPTDTMQAAADAALAARTS